jgi:transposase
MVNQTIHGRAPFVIMVWGAIWLGGRSDIVIMERDDTSHGGGYTTNSYIDALEAGLSPHYQPGQIFQQDNARIHTSDKAKRWFEDHGIWVIIWPPHSPDQNPIEHVWRELKRALNQLHPDINTLKDNALDREKLKGWIREAWWSIPQAKIDNLLLSIPRRIAALRKAKGWYTKY